MGYLIGTILAYPILQFYNEHKQIVAELIRSWTTNKLFS